MKIFTLSTLKGAKRCYYKECNMNKVFSKAKIMLPNKNVDMEKWSVVACDQYTSEPEYWEKAWDLVGDAPSMLNLVLPEIYLESDDVAERIDGICNKMDKYMAEGVFTESEPTYIYLERTQADGKVRKGIVGKIDLECYDYSKGSKSPVRATEGTILSRIPPRVKVRENASIESPHIMILIDDAEKKIIEPLADKKDGFETAYDFTLMQNSGSLKGYFLPDNICEEIDARLNELCDLDKFNAKYNVAETSPLAYAMGDGNHSLATAKALWETLKKQGADINTHPARYALAEIVNLHDDALTFEPIHRVLFGIDENEFLKFLTENGVKEAECGCGQVFEMVIDGESKNYCVKNPTANITVGSVQNLIDEYFKSHTGTVDYIHGDDVVRDFGKVKSNIGILFDVMDKSELFKTVILDGALPRKTFSMGHAHDKRFYTECRKIK